MFANLVIAINQRRFSEHLESIRKIFVWGSGVEIQAVAFLFQMEIYEVTDSLVEREARWLWFKPHNATILNGLDLTVHMTIATTLPWLELAHISGSHYDSVIPADPSAVERFAPPELTGGRTSEGPVVID